MYQSSQGSLANNAKGGNAASLELPFQNPVSKQPCAPSLQFKLIN